MAGNVRGRGGFESLEPRQLLAGDVLLSVVGGTLLLQGDASDNQIMVTSGSEAGTFVVTGLDGTTITEQGQASASSVTVEGVRSARVRLGDDNDLVAVVGANLGGSLTIDGGLGNDRIFVGTGGDAAELAGQLPADLSVNVRGAVSIRGDAGADQISVDNATIGTLLTIDAGLEDDIVELGSEAAAPAAVGAAVNEATAQLKVRGAVHVALGVGNDQLAMHQLASRGAIAVRGGVGNNAINASHISSAALAVSGDGGMDNVTLANIHAHALAVHTGSGNDHVDARDSVFGSIGVSLDGDNDTLTTANLRARIAILLGGLGDDTYDQQGENHFVHELIRGFEFPPGVNTVPGVRRVAGRLR